MRENYYEFCDKNENFSIVLKYCNKQCIKECNEEYYKLDFKKQYSMDKSNTFAKIKFENSKEFQYRAESSHTLVDYISNIGGFFGLWIGMAFIDINFIIKLSINRIKIFLDFENLLQ